MKPKIFVADKYGNRTQKCNVKQKHFFTLLNKFKLGIAIFLDVIDLLIGWIPIINTLWDFVTISVLFIILKEKRLATVSLIELPLIGIPPLSFLDQFIPVATIITLLDIVLSNRD